MATNEILNIILLSVFILSSIVHLYFFVFVFLKFAVYKESEKENTKKAVSVIICAKNELNNLRKHLKSVLDQTYPDYEVIVVNDGSWDETKEYLEQVEKNNSRLRIVTIPDQDKYRHGKKFAITLGIKAARHELLLFTDADCMPVSKNWIELMQRNFSKQTEIVLGFGAYKRERGWLNKLIRFDTFMVVMQYFSFALKGNAYMGVGRNLAYRKSLFFQKKGFAKHNHIFSGDDDLFVNECATPVNIAVEANPDSFTLSEPKKTFIEWFRQKRRHSVTSKYYKFSHRFQLSLFYLSNIIFLALLITLLILRYRWELVMGIYLFKFVTEWSIGFMAAKKLKEQDIMWYYPVLEIIYTFLLPLFFISSIFTKELSWK